MASEQAEEKGPANRNSRAESKQGSRRKRRALLIVIPLLLARAAAAGLAVAYRSGMRQHNGPQGTQTSRIARGSHSARGDNSNSSASPGTEGQEGSDAGSSGRVNSSAKGTGSDAGGDNSIEDFPGTDVYKPYIPSNSPRAPKDAERGQGAGSNRDSRGNSGKDSSNNANKSNGSRPDNGAAGSGSNGSSGTGGSSGNGANGSGNGSPGRGDEEQVAHNAELMLFAGHMRGDGLLVLSSAGNSSLPDSAVVGLKRNGENPGEPNTLQWSGRHLADVKAHRKGTYAIYAQTREDVVIHQKNYGRPVIKVIVQVE